MERAVSNEKTRSSMNVENGSSKQSSAKKRSSLGIETGKADAAAASTADKRASLRVETTKMDTTSTDKTIESPRVEAGTAETSLCDNGNSPSTPETVSRYERQFSLNVRSDQLSSTYKKRWSVSVDTVQYKVQENDTLLSISARFGMGPSELKQLNKLMTNQVYTGQKLLIYTKNFSDTMEREQVQKLADQERERAEKQVAVEKYRTRLRTEEANFAPPSDEPTDAPRSRHSSIVASDSSHGVENPSSFIPHYKITTLNETHQKCSQQPDSRRPQLNGMVIFAAHEFSRISSGRTDDLSDCMSEKSVDKIIRNIKKNRLRLGAKYVTDGQGVVSGTLLVTTNTIMFDPNVSDRLVMDRGSTSYVMVAPFEYVVRLAIVDDIAAMKWQSDNKTQPPKIYQGCAFKESESAGELASSDRDELLSSLESSVSAEKHDSQVFANGTSPPPTTNSRDTSEDENVGGDLTEFPNTLKNSPAKQKSAEPVEIARSTDTVVMSHDSTGDHVNSDTCSNRTNQVLIKNRMNLCDMPMENSPRLGLFAQKRLSSQASYGGLFPIDDIDPVNDHSFPSSFSPLNEVLAASRACNSPALVGSPLMRTSSYKTSPYDITSTSSPFRRKPSSSNVGEMNGTSFGCRPSFSSLMEMHAESPSKLIPVYSAKSMNRVGSSLTTGDSFCIPPGQNFIIDLQWEQFGQLRDEDGWCTSVRDLPPIPDEDVHEMEKPDFFISDDEDEDGDDDSQSKSSEVKEKSSEVDVQKLLKSIDDIYKALDVLIPRPATHYDDLPWYLCVVIGHPMPGKAEKVLSTEPYSTENMKPAYWFSIHRQDVHPLYEFIMTHFSNIYGSEDKVNPADRGLMILSQELLNAKLQASPSTCQFYLDEFENMNVPELSEESRILDDNQLAKLNGAMFPRAKDSYWRLVYSIERDGTSLQTLYRKMSYWAEHDPPCVIVVRDSSRTVFGAVLSCTVKRSKEYFGNGQSFLFSFRDGFKKYSASCTNEYYGYGYRDSLCFGAHHGKCGLWLDGDLHHGRTQKCATYNNDVLTMTEDFYVHQLEAWSLI